MQQHKQESFIPFRTSSIRFITIVIALVLLVLALTFSQRASAEISQSFLTGNSLSIDEIEEYLVIAMGDDSDVGRAFQMSNSEIGADRDVLSDSSDPDFSVTNGGFPNLLDVFDDRSNGGSNNRWDTSGNPDTVSVSGIGVVSPAEGIDYSGEVALTSNGGRFDFSNSIVFADTGIQGTVSNPAQGTSNSFHADIGETTQGTSDSLGLGSGATGNNNFSTLLSDLGDWKTVIEGLSAEVTITNISPFQNNEANGGVIQGTSGNGLITTYDSSDDTNNDGVVVIDVNLGGDDFDLTNLDWAIIAEDGVLPIFRIRNGSNMLMSNVSILVNNGDTSDIGAIFYSGYEGDSGDTVFNGDNIVLNGVAFWDLNEVGEGGGDVKTQITINNGQGCAQFISQKVDFQNNRWNRCALGVAAPELGNLEITKVVDWNGVRVRNRSFEICIQGPSYPNGDESGACQTVNQDGGVLTWTDLELGDYIVSETVPDSNWSAQISSSPATIVAGETAEVTITNTHTDAAGIYFRKVVPDGEGDPNNPSQVFDIRYGNGDRNIGASAPANGGVFGRNDLPADTWRIREISIPANWTLDDITCESRDGTSTFGTFTPETNFLDIELGIGDRVDCIVTNSYDPPPTITLVKAVINDNGGTNGPNDFGLTIGGTSVDSGDTLNVPAGVPVALNEVGLSGYSFVSISGDDACPAVLGGTVTLASGENITCTITNDDDPPPTATIVVAKQTNPAEDPTDFGLSTNSVGDLEFKHNTVHSIGGLPAGTWTFTEGEVDGWVLTDIDCDDDNVSIDLENRTLSITVTGDEEISCLFINTKTSTITLRKEVSQGDPNNPDQNFTLDIYKDNAVVAGLSTFTDGSEAFATNLLPGDYTVREIFIPDGWAVEDIACTSTNGNTIFENFVSGETTLDVALAAGDNVKCTFTNRYAPPSASITIVKEVVEGSTTSEFDFEIDLGNSVNSFILSDGDSKTYSDLPSGDYVINETFPIGESDDWEALTAEDIVCESTGGSTFEYLPFAGESDTFGTKVTLAEGDDVICTFKNTEKPATGSLEVTKFIDWYSVTPDESKTFEICIQGPSYPNGDESGACQEIGFDGGLLTWDDLEVGDYTVSETDPGDEWAVFINGSPATVAENETAEASVNNQYKVGDLFVYKYNDLNGNGSVDLDEPFLSNWEMTIYDSEQNFVGSTTTNELGQASFEYLVIGDYIVCETQQNGWVNTNDSNDVFEFDGKICQNQTIEEFSFFSVYFANQEEPEDLRLNLTAECVVGDTLFWRVTNDEDVDIDFTWNGPGANDGSGTATANSRTYFTTQDAGGANTTIINWTNPIGSPNSKTKAHNNQTCVYHVDFAKEWSGGDAPDLDGAVLLTAESSLGTAECTSDDGALTCTYTTGDDLHVPFGETYTVNETPVDGWQIKEGTGSGFTGINGFDLNALPDDLIYDIADDRFCESNPNAAFPINLEKFCTHTVVNELPPPDLRLNLTAECAVGDTLFWRVTNNEDVDIDFTWQVYGSSQNGSGVAMANGRTYFTTTDEGGANTTKIFWDNPATSKNPDDRTKAHNNQQCVYHVDFAKEWNGADAPDLDGATLLTAESSLGTATCTSDDGALTCTYSTGDDLHVPFGETYTVNENTPSGWVTSEGTGSGFTGIAGFDLTALPNALVYDVADDRYCESNPDASFPFNLEKFCTHTVVNQRDLKKISPVLECVAPIGDTGMYRAFFGYNNPNDVTVDIPVGPNNKFNRTPQDQGQPTSFIPGRTPFFPNAAFSVDFDGSNLVWTLNGKTATASDNPVQRCNFYVELDKEWTGADAPDNILLDLISATSTADELTCDWDGTDLVCNGDNLKVPVSIGDNDEFVGEYSVSEDGLPEGWNVLSGTGDFTVPNDHCEGKFCTHTVVNEKEILKLERLIPDCFDAENDQYRWRVRNPHDVEIPFTLTNPAGNVILAEGIAAPNGDTTVYTDKDATTFPTILRVDGVEQPKGRKNPNVTPCAPTTGNITVVKVIDWGQDVDEAPDTQFNFSGDLGGFTLGDGDSYTMKLPAGSYDIAEVYKYNWGVQEISCDGGDPEGITRGVNVDLEAGDDITCTFTNTPRCVNPRADLSAVITWDENTAMAHVTNDSDALCVWEVGMASYEKYNEVIDEQDIFDWTDGNPVPPGETIKMTIDKPQCAVQVDVFIGEVLLSLDGNRYGDRLLAWQHLHQDGYCERPVSKVDGYVSADGSGLQGVTVTLTNAQADGVTFEATTNIDGYYAFRDVPNGSYRVEISGDVISGMDMDETSAIVQVGAETPAVVNFTAGQAEPTAVTLSATSTSTSSTSTMMLTIIAAVLMLATLALWRRPVVQPTRK